MKTIILLTILAVLGGCTALQQQRAVSDAYASEQVAKSDSVASCANAPALCVQNCAALTPAAQEKCVDKCDNTSECMLGNGLIFAAGGSSAVPVVQSELSTVLNSSLLSTGVSAGFGYMRDTRVAESQERTNIAIAGFNAQTQTAMFGAFSGVAQSGFSANQAIANAGFGASGVGFLALERLGTSAVNAGAATANALTKLPPTTQIFAGRDVIQARDVDQSTTGQNRTQGNANEVARNVDCVSSGGPGGSATGSNAGSAAGTTSPTSTAYNALTSGLGGGAVNNCGG